ncbi:codanin-1-like [Mya arenaria]|uniref:codanin-1-like n=1 Tax=Mya arenaria TaxID=6604 RepID=UPI0022E77F88|nr:codanin-1-like [Mya arenaria]
MASILELVLQDKLSSDILVAWLKNDKAVTVPNELKELANVKQEFIPFFLNYLRDHTVHLIQSSSSATPSPAKTPSLKKLQKSVKRTRDHGKRQQLFGASPAGDADDFHNLPASVFSPNTSIDSPGHFNPVNQKGDRNHGKGYRGQKASPQCGSQRSGYSQQTPEQRSKQKLSLAEFITPEQGGQSWKKKSPHSGNRRELSCSMDNTPTNFATQGRKSGGKKRHSYSPLVQNSVTPSESPAPVFCLTNSSDFPPMGGEGKHSKKNNRRSLDSNLPVSENCDNKTSRVINFSNTKLEQSSGIGKFARDRLQEVKRISPVTIQTNNSGPRRITPTLVKTDNSVQQNSAFLGPIDENEKPNPVFQSSTEVPSSSDVLQEERKLLQEQKAKSGSRSSEGPTPQGRPTTSVATPTKLALEHSTSVVEIREACLGEVTHLDKLDTLVSLYAKCLEGNLFPNMVVELYFLVQLLAARGGEVEDTFVYGNDVIEVNYLSSIHNTVYFAVSSLDLQRRFVCMVDRCTLRLLLENVRVATFSPDLLSYLEHCYNKAELKKGSAFLKSPIGSVSFQADTDNRKNFPTDKSFHLFRKQRDGFYELLREWEASRMNPNYKMREVFGDRVRVILGGQTDLANMIHFARLFMYQLIAMCKGEGSIRNNDDDESIALLSQLKRTNPEKFKRLQERFIKPLSVGGPCPGPTFPGIQEFFRDFIMVGCNPQLNQHLNDMFTAKVLELNDTSFATHDDEDAAAGNGDDEEREVFVSVLLSLRLVSKFLGFVTFLPYQSTDRIPDSIETTYINTRNRHLPSVDLKACLCSAVANGNLTLTVPWVVEYLSMMDPLAPRLDVFQEVLLLLLYIHRYVWVQLLDEPSYGNLQVTALISWLMENSVIPDGMFFYEIPENISTLVKDSMPSLAALDNRSFVDQSLFYTCCPYIGELKTLLVDFSVGCSSKISTVRKITPISADIPTQTSITHRQLQLQLEENFFHNHPASMKRVVDFVADRTASNFIKKFRAGLLHTSVDHGKAMVLEQLLLAMPEGSPSSKLKDRIPLVTMKVAQDLVASMRAQVSVQAPSYCHTKVPALMALLLPDDQSENVLAMVSGIGERIAGEKITAWINKHLTMAMYQSEIMPDPEKVTKTLSSAGQDRTSPVKSLSTGNQSREGEIISATSHNESLKHPSEVFIDFKDCIKNVCLRGANLSEERVWSLLGETRRTFEHRRDILPSVHRSFTQLTLELLLYLLVSQPALYKRSVIEECTSLWKTVLHDKTSLGQVFSGRVVTLVSQASDQQKAWRDYTQLLSEMYKLGLMPPGQLTDSGNKFINKIKEKELITRLVHCLCEVGQSMSDTERAEILGTSLQLLYNMLPEDCDEALLILKALGFTNNNNGIFGAEDKFL